MRLRFAAVLVALSFTISSFSSEIDHSNSPTQARPPVEASTPSLGRLQIASLNMQGFDKTGTRLAAMARKIVADLGGPEASPDVFLLQEVMRVGDSSTAHALAAELKKLGVEYHVVFKERENLKGDHPEGLAILSKEPIAADSIRSLALSNPTEAEVGKARWWPRVALGVEFESKRLGLVRIVNTHHESNPEGVGTRLRQLGEVQNWIAEAEAKRPAVITILGGDFNPNTFVEDYRSREFSTLWSGGDTGRMRFRDHNGYEGSWQDPKTKKFDERLDYVFVNERPGVRHNGERLIRLQDNGKDLTDHQMLVQDFEWFKQ